MFKRFIISDSSNVRCDDFARDYIAMQHIYNDYRREYTETNYRAVTLYNVGAKLSYYNAIAFGKRGKVYRIIEQYDRTYDVEISHTVKVDGDIYHRIVYCGKFPTLYDAIRAKQAHYKD